MTSLVDGLRGHPRQLYPLTHVALWHIAAYAGLIGHLVLVMTAAPGEYGYGWTNAEAIRLYGLFTGLVHGSPIVGGWIADAFLGQRRAAVLGMWLQTAAFVMLVAVGLVPGAVGHLHDAPVREVILAADVPIARLGLDDGQAARVLAEARGHAANLAGAEALHGAAVAAYDAMSLLFYGALLTFVAGYGLQFPTLAAMVGSLYEGTQAKREGGYTLFFMAAMVGFIVGALVSGTIASLMGWSQGLAAAGAMMVLAAVLLTRVRPSAGASVGASLGSSLGTSVEASIEVSSAGAARPRRPSLSRVERRRVAAICGMCVAYFVFIAAFEQWGGSFSLFVEHDTDRVVRGFEVPTLWIHSTQALFVLIVGPIMLAAWSALDERGVCREPPAKMGVGLLLTACAFGILVAVLPSGHEEAGDRTHLFWPLAYYWVITFGQMTVVPVGQAFVSREAPPGIANTMMGVWLMFGGVGIWVSGQIGALAEPLGLGAVYLGIATGCALAGVAMFAFRKKIMNLLVA